MYRTRKVPPDDVLRHLYLDLRLSSFEIAKQYACTHTNVCKHLRRLGITRPESGPNSRNRNFKVKQYRRGYPVTFLPDHPRANHIGYVFDHLLAAEKKWGKTPTRQNHIHHIDLDSSNPDPNNLHWCETNSEHQRLHASLDRIVSQLIKRGIIRFQDGKYFVPDP